MRIARIIRLALLAVAGLTVSAIGAAACEPWPDCAFEARKTREQSEEIVRQAKNSAAQNLLIFNKLNVLDVSDEIVGSTDIRSLVGSYAYFEPGKKTLQIIGANFEGDVERIQLKDRRLFEGVVRRGFDLGVSVAVLKVGLKSQQVAELVIDDIAFASMEAKADQISCNFPVAFREQARQGRIRPVFIKSAVISRVRKRYFTKSKVSGSGTYLMISADGKFHVSDESAITHFVVTPQVVPAMPALAADCVQNRSATVTKSGARLGFDIADAGRTRSTADELRARLEAQKDLTGEIPTKGIVMTLATSTP